MTVLRAGSATDVGQVRTINQDCVFASAALCAVADGMGGHVGGEVASTSAIDVLERHLGSLSSRVGVTEALQMANQSIVDASKNDPSLAGMGTTMVVATLMATEHGDVLLVANIGDSRAYLFRKGNVSQITDDHSVPAEMVRAGSLTEAEAKVHPQRHVITRALGIPGAVDPDFFELILADGDRILLCSDGLSNEVDNEEIARVLASISDPGAAAEDLVRRAHANGGADNISAVVLDALVTDEHLDEPTQAHAIVAPLAAVAPPRTDVPSAPEQETFIDREEVPTPKKEGWYARRKRLGMPRILTVRLVVFLLLLGGVVYGCWYFLRWYANSTYYVTSQGTQLVVYHGRPGGFLWFKPTLVEVSPISTSQVLPLRLPTLQSDVTETSLRAANSYIANLHDEYLQSTASSATTTTTAPASSLPALVWHVSSAI